MKDITMRKRVLMTILPIAIIPIILVARECVLFNDTDTNIDKY